MYATVVALIHTVDWTRPSWDLFLLAFFVVISIIYATKSTRGSVVVTLASTYMALVITNYLPFLGQYSGVNIGGVFIFKVSAFLASIFALSFLMGKSALASGTKKSGSRIQVFIFSFLHIGLMMAAVFSFLPASVTANLAPLTATLFVNKIALFVWIVLPILFMILFRSKARAESSALKDD